MSIMIFLLFMHVLTLNLCVCRCNPRDTCQYVTDSEGIPHDFNPQGEGGEEDEMVHNLEGITQGVPDYAHFDDFPCACRRHIVGVPSRIHRLLRQLVWAVTCYHKHHAD